MNKGTIRKIPIMVLLCFTTFGIYYLYWIYKVTDEIKNFTNKKNVNPSLDIILTIVSCGLYSYYWYYKIGKIVYTEMPKMAGIYDEEDSTILLVILNYFMCVISAAILQDKLNYIWAKTPDYYKNNYNNDDNEIKKIEYSYPDNN